MDASRFAQSVIDSMGPEWWAGQVQYTLVNAQVGLVSSILLLIGFVIYSLIVIRLARRGWDDIGDRSRDDRWFGIGFAVGLPGIIMLMVPFWLVSSWTTLQQPEWVAWQNLVTEVSAVLR